MKNNRILILLCGLAAIVVVTLGLLNRHARLDSSHPPDAVGKDPASSSAQMMPGLSSSANAPNKAAQVISGLDRHQSRTSDAPSGDYFYDLSAPHAGQMVIATVKVGEHSHKLSPNEMGNFDRVHVAPRQTIPVKLQYPEAQPGQSVVVQVMDGGTMVAPERPPGIDNDLVRLLTLDASRCAEMAFTVTANGGMHRLVLTRDADKKVLDFWVVKDPQDEQAKEMAQ
jgi:hypothetical protein